MKLIQVQQSWDCRSQLEHHPTTPQETESKYVQVITKVGLEIYFYPSITPCFLTHRKERVSNVLPMVVSQLDFANQKTADCCPWVCTFYLRVSQIMKFDCSYQYFL